MNSNQVVHNRGRALAYLGGGDKKRSRAQAHLPDDDALDFGGGQRKPQHQYKRKQELTTWQTPAFLQNLLTTSEEIRQTRDRLAGVNLSSDSASIS